MGVFDNPEGTYLLNWMEQFSTPICDAFNRKARPFGYRISRYLDEVIDVYGGLEYPSRDCVSDNTTEIFQYQKHNIALTIAGAYRLLAEGLFVQSGILLRTAIESSLVMLETATNPDCIDLIDRNKYQSQSVLKRVKDIVPPDVVRWYGYFSANFTHVAALHQSGYMPRACYPDNWVIVTGLQNIVRATVTYHALLERAYIDWVVDPHFWEVTLTSTQFREDNKVFRWVNSLGLDVAKALPTNHTPPGIERSPRKTTLKV